MKYKHIKNIFVVFALQRSGHHGIMDWIRHSYNGDTVFYNDSIFGESPHTTCLNFWKNEKFYRFNAEQCDDFPEELDCLVWNYENFNPRSYNEKKLQKIISDITKTYDNLYLVTISRDPFNNQASMYRGSRKQRKINLEVWKDYAREYLNKSSIIPGAIHIDYTVWLMGKDKRELYDKICGERPYKPLYETISPHGNGSTFNVFEINAKIATVNGNERWKTFTDTNEFNELLNDKELISLSKEMYGDKFVNNIINKGE